MAQEGFLEIGTARLVARIAEYEIAKTSIIRRIDVILNSSLLRLAERIESLGESNAENSSEDLEECKKEKENKIKVLSSLNDINSSKKQSLRELNELIAIQDNKKSELLKHLESLSQQLSTTKVELVSLTHGFQIESSTFNENLTKLDEELNCSQMNIEDIHKQALDTAVKIDIQDQAQIRMAIECHKLVEDATTTAKECETLSTKVAESNMSASALENRIHQEVLQASNLEYQVSQTYPGKIEHERMKRISYEKRNNELMEDLKKLSIEVDTQAELMISIKNHISSINKRVSQ